MKSLAIKYRPKEFRDVVEQTNIKTILQQQISQSEFNHTYLFVGGAGTGKTTCARIFAQEINKYQGNPIEIDGASHNGVDDVREIINLAQTKSIDSEYKVFIIDECHMLSVSAWNAMLKLIEEPPIKSIFIFCTTDPQKIPATIISRVQRYDFQLISRQGIVNRLKYILHEEKIYESKNDLDTITTTLNYIATIANGHMRNAITMLDKCLGYSCILTLDNVINALGVADYSNMMKLLSSITDGEPENMITELDDIAFKGIDLKQFIRQFIDFVYDVKVYSVTGKFELTQLPNTDDMCDYLDSKKNEYDTLTNLLNKLVKLNSDIKYDNNPKYLIGCALWEVLDESNR